VTEICLQIGARKVFACASWWPGWCRARRDEDAALSALAAATPRYAAVCGHAGIPFEAASAATGFEIIERVTRLGHDGLRRARCRPRSTASPLRRRSLRS